MGAPATYEERLRSSFWTMLGEVSEHFMGRGEVRATLKRLGMRLGEEGIPYALAGGMALGEHGYVRMTEDVDVVLAPEGLARFGERLVGRGYVPAYPGAQRSFRDVESGVRIEVLVTGEFPGDGKPKPVAFPDPATSALEVEGIRVLPLPRVVELKLASGMSAPGRLRDLADVQELIKVLRLGEDFALQLDASVRARFLELLTATRQG